MSNLNRYDKQKLIFVYIFIQFYVSWKLEENYSLKYIVNIGIKLYLIYFFL